MAVRAAQASSGMGQIAPRRHNITNGRIAPVSCPRARRLGLCTIAATGAFLPAFDNGCDARTLEPHHAHSAGPIGRERTNPEISEHSREKRVTAKRLANICRKARRFLSRRSVRNRQHSLCSNRPHPHAWRSVADGQSSMQREAV
jgi:hypothetical protein